MDTLFVPGLQPALKHKTVFSKFDALPAGDAFLLVNDHDPIPLFYEMKAERGEVFDWIKVENGPEVWQVQIVKKSSAEQKKFNQEMNTIVAEDVPVLNVTLIEPKLKHPTIFQHFDALKPGEAFQLLNDHDPKPLYYQLIAERGNVFTWTYLEKGPQHWQVQIQKIDVAKGETVGEIAAKDLRKAEVFKKYGIDFCCGGKKTLQQVCEEKGIDPAVMESELDASQNTAAVSAANDFNRWQPDFLSDYIYNQHHIYYYEEMPVIMDLMEKVKSRHGEHFPELATLHNFLLQLTSELDAHFIKEEKIVFPFIKALMQAKRTGDFTALESQPSLTEPVRMMESEHENAGDLLAQIQQLTNDYTPPSGACNSFQFLYKKLKALDEDLHQHIHLENNLLFPKALAVEKSLAS
ncbi:MAG TPA: iron-sulfur cluster repair di-iron protein [Flavisolibacter sp.]|nr:iron-sulfur cluster repair di-iron protein [Flavisolibacter sp.]